MLYSSARKYFVCIAVSYHTKAYLCQHNEIRYEEALIACWILLFIYTDSYAEANIFGLTVKGSAYTKTVDAICTQTSHNSERIFTRDNHEKLINLLFYNVSPLN